MQQLDDHYTPQIVVYENSYRMEPKENEKFSRSAVLGKMTEILDRELAQATYDPKTAKTLPNFPDMDKLNVGDPMRAPGFLQLHPKVPVGETAA